MESSLQSAGFFTIARGESVVGEFEVLDKRKFCLLDLLVGLFLALPCLALLVLSFTAPPRDQNSILLAALVFALPPLAYMVGAFLLRRSLKGWLVLTTERLGYYQRWSSVIGNGHLVFQVNLSDLVGINTFYHRGLWAEVVGFEILTRFTDGFMIGSRRAAMPLLAPLLPRTLGKDAFLANHVMYGLMDQVRQRKGER